MGEEIDVEIFDFLCPCGEGKKGSFVRFYSKQTVRCPHCLTEFPLVDMTRIQHQR
jgi:hypothetical protein